MVMTIQFFGVALSMAWRIMLIVVLIMTIIGRFGSMAMAMTMTAILEIVVQLINITINPAFNTAHYQTFITI